MVRKVKDAWDYVPCVGEYNDPKKFGHYVETIGYVPIEKQVNSFFRAGQIIAGNEAYDTTEDDPQDDPSLNCREWEREDVGMAMTRLGASLSSSAEEASKIEASKNEISGDAEGTTEEKSN